MYSCPKCRCPQCVSSSIEPLQATNLLILGRVLKKHCLVVWQDLVREVASGAALKTNNHRIFKLEDVAMGSWIEYIAKEKGWAVQYVSHTGFNFMGCNPTDVVSHYIKPDQARCIHEHEDKTCCSQMGRRRRSRSKSHFLSFFL